MFPDFALSIIFSLFLRFFPYILENPSFPILYFFGTFLDFSSSSCYTITRYQTRKTKVLQGFRRFPAQNESCVRDLPHVKQN